MLATPLPIERQIVALLRRSTMQYKSVLSLINVTLPAFAAERPQILIACSMLLLSIDGTGRRTDGHPTVT